MSGGLIQKVLASSKKQIVVFIILLVVVNVALYVKTINYSFLKDDYRLVVENQRIKSASAFIESLDDKFFSFPDFAFLQYWRPIVLLSFFCDFQVWQLNPAGYHLSNILLNAALALMIFFILYLLCKQSLIAFLITLFYSLHPARVEAVAWISGRTDLLSAAGILGALLCFILFLKEVKGKNLLLTGMFLLFTCALLAKENAVIFPLMIGGFVYLQPVFHEFAGKKRKLKQMALILLGVIIILSVYLVIHNHFTGSMELTSSLSIKQIPVMAKAIGVYVKMILAPFFPSPHFAMPYFDANSLILIGYLLIGLVVLLFVLANRDHYPMTLFSLLFLVMLIPVVNPELLPTYPKIALRFVYLPAVMAAAFFLETLFVFKNKWLKKVYAVLMLTLASIWLVQVIHFQNYYKNHNLHYQKLVIQHPDDCSLLLPWALIKARAGEVRQALQVVERALILDKGDNWVDISETAGLLKANLLVAMGALEQGKQLADTIVKNARDNGVRYNGWLIIAKYHEKKKDFAAALAALERGKQLGETADLFFRIALIYNKMDDFAGADQAIKKALHLNPENATFKQFQSYLQKKYPPYPLKR